MKMSSNLLTARLCAVDDEELNVCSLQGPLSRFERSRRFHLRRADLRGEYGARTASGTHCQRRARAPPVTASHVSRSKRLIGHSIARTIVPATSAASHRPRRPSLERIKKTFSRTTMASVARAISR